MQREQKRCIQRADFDMPIVFKHKGDFKKTDRFFKRLSHLEINSVLNKYGARGVDALQAATPVDSGKTAGSWKYEIDRDRVTKG